MPKAAALLALLASARGAELALRALPDALARGLVCNDGSGAGYYIAEGQNPDRVLIYQAPRRALSTSPSTPSRLPLEGL